jgi:hypothetical protein
VRLTQHDEVNVSYAALSLLSNLAFSSVSSMETMLRASLLRALTSLYAQLSALPLSTGNVLQRLQLNFLVSCVAASPSPAHLRHLLRDSPLVDAMIADMASDVFDISKEAAWAVGNLTRGYWPVQRKDREGRYDIRERGGELERETRERRRLLAAKPGLMRGLCGLLALEFEEDDEHCELIQLGLVSISNLLSDEWWVHERLRADGDGGLRRAEETRRSNAKALSLAKHLCPSVSVLHAHPPCRLSPEQQSDDAAATDALPLPPYPCFQDGLSSSLPPQHYASFPTASPLHPPAIHPLTAAFLNSRGLCLLARLEACTLPFVREYANWCLCIFFTEYCRDHEEHASHEYETDDTAQCPLRL